MRSILFWCVGLVAIAMLGISVSCDPNHNNNNNPDSTKECTTTRDCWKKVCTETDADAFDSCLRKELSSDEHPPKYKQCNANKCEEIPAADQGDGTVEVSFPATTQEKLAKDQVKWLRLYIFPPYDLDGKAITCKRLEDLLQQAPKSIMSPSLNRFYPPPSWTTPITTDVKRVGDTMDLPFISTQFTVPKGTGRVVVVQGFCNPAEGRPVLETKHMWLACKEGVETKAGKKANTISIELPVKNGDRCPIP